MLCRTSSSLRRHTEYFIHMIIMILELLANGVSGYGLRTGVKVDGVYDNKFLGILNNEV